MGNHSASRSFRSFTVDSVPEHDGIYMIRHIDSGKAITAVDGQLTLVRDPGTRGGWQWKCEELHDGWVGFRDVAFHKYLGRDNKGGFRAEANKMKDWESFVLRPREAGGYNLLAKYWSMLKGMAVADSDGTSPKLVEVPTAQEAARWEFVSVD